MKCLLCGKEIRGFAQLKRHTLAKHLNGYGFYCPICEKEFRRHYTLITHCMYQAIRKNDPRHAQLYLALKTCQDRNPVFFKVREVFLKAQEDVKK